MKKIIVCVAALLIGFVVTAQDKKADIEKKSALSFNIGPAMPIGDFESTNEDNENAGFAKTGFHFNLNYDYKFVKNAGVAFNFLYGYHNLHKELLNELLPGTDMNHYQYVGFLVGPMFRGELSPKTDINFRLMGGVGRSNSPEFAYQGETLMKEDWASAFAIKFDADVRFNMKKNVFFLVNLGYTQMRPEFEIKELSGWFGDNKFEMHISALNVNAGMGVKF
jgi:Outer membrane protein beta-barrel domain